MYVGSAMREQLLRRINRHIAGYETIYTTQKTNKKTSQLRKLFHARLAKNLHILGLEKKAMNQNLLNAQLRNKKYFIHIEWTARGH